MRKSDGRPTSGIDLLEDTSLELSSIDRRLSAELSVHLGAHDVSSWALDAAGLRIVIPPAEATDLAAIVTGGQDTLLLYRSN